MGDICDTNAILLSPDGDNYGLLTDEEKEKSDISQLAYTERDKKALRQYEGAAVAAKAFSKLSQGRRNTSPYMLFGAHLAVQQTTASYFTIYFDISHMDRTTDLCACREKTILVKRFGENVTAIEKNCIKVETMDPLIEDFCDKYSQDMTTHLGLDEDVLPDALGMPTLLNPFFGPQKRIVEAGLMSAVQACRARIALLRKMQDVLDNKDPAPLYSTDSDDKDDEEDEEYTPRERVNANYKKAEEELELLDEFKRKKYRPSVIEENSVVLKSDINTAMDIWVGPLNPDSKGKNLPSGKNLFDYTDVCGRFKMLEFYSAHQKLFPTLWIVAQAEAPCRVVKAGCERFFRLSGYISSPRRTRLNVRTYE